MPSRIVGPELNDLNLMFDKNIERIENLLDKGYLNEPIILIVTIFEVYFRDLFKMTRSVWFGNSPATILRAADLENRFKTRTKIKIFLQSIKLYDEFINNLYVYECSYNNDDENDLIGDPDIDCMYHTLYPKENTRILNFQDLRKDNKYSAKNAFAAFYDFNINEHLDDDSTISSQKWNELLTLFEERRHITHKGNDTTFTKESIQKSVNSIKFLKDKTLQMITEKMSH